MRGPVDPRLLRRARATQEYLVAGLGVGLATALLVIGQAWLLSQLVVDVFATHRPPALAPLAWLGAVFAARAALAWANQVLAHRAAARAKSTLRSDVVEARLRAPLAPTSTAEQITLLTQGLDALDGYFSKYLLQLGLAATVPVLVGAAILWADWVSAAILAVTLPLIPLFMVLIGRATQQRMDRRWNVQRRLARHFADLIAGLATLQVFGRARAQERGLAQTEDRHRRETMGTLRLSFLSSLVLELLGTLSVALIAVGIGLRVVAGQMPFQTGLFVLVLAPEAYLPIRMVGVHYHDSVDGLAAADQALRAIEAGAAAPRGTAVPPPGDVVFAGVGHTYPGAAQAALRPLDLTLRPGTVTVLAGRSGCGKSTALAALMGFLAPTEGEIRVAGTPLGELDARAWRRRLAWVGQQPGMVNGTIGANVALGHPGAGDAEIAAALERAGGGSLDPARPVGDDGEGLSAGERRRVALARALLRIDHGASLLVLDEPTAGLDADAEAAVLAGIRASGAGALVVSHRPAVLAAADAVVRLP